MPQDYIQAAFWYRKAADQGDDGAQNNLAILYDNGQGVPQDHVRAVHWYRIAADQGSTNAQFNLALNYSKGEGVPQDDAWAVHWLRKAANQNHDAAQYLLGIMYRHGEGVPQDYVEAYKWQSLAEAQSHESAAEEIKELGKIMTPTQISAAEKRAREWSPVSADGTTANARRLISTGSGFMVNYGGHVVTNDHVFDDCADIRAFPPGDTAVIKARDRTNDLALLKLRTSHDMLPSRFRAGPVRLGEQVVAAGYPLRGLAGEGLNITRGEVSALSGSGGDPRHLQMTAPVQPGNSGGPLLDRAGLVSGVVVSRLDALETARATGGIPQNVNFAIRTGVVRSFLDANNVSYKSTTGDALYSTEEIAQSAREYTVLIECWR